MDWLFSWGVTSAIAFFLVGLGFTVLGYRDFTFAKSCFVLAATDAIGSAVMWGIKNQGSLAVTALVVFLAAGTLAVLTLFAFKYADTKERTWTLAVEKPEAPAPPPEAYKHSPPPTPKEQKPLPPAPAHQEEQKPTPPPEQHLRVITEGIRSLRVDLRLTFTPKDGAKLPEGNDPFLFLSQDQSKIQGGAG